MKEKWSVTDIFVSLHCSHKIILISYYVIKHSQLLLLHKEVTHKPLKLFLSHCGSRVVVIVTNKSAYYIRNIYRDYYTMALHINH